MLMQRLPTAGHTHLLQVMPTHCRPHLLTCRSHPPTAGHAHLLQVTPIHCRSHPIHCRSHPPTAGHIYLLQVTPTHCRSYPPTAGHTHPTAGHTHPLQVMPTPCRPHLLTAGHTPPTAGHTHPMQATPTSSMPHPLTTSVILRRAIESKRSVGTGWSLALQEHTETSHKRHVRVLWVKSTGQLHHRRMSSSTTPLAEEAELDQHTPSFRVMYSLAILHCCLNVFLEDLVSPVGLHLLCLRRR